MHKVYLLLRNNKQTGPYSLDELLQQGLMPYDLVWEEGKSAAWRYPGEIATLKPFAPAPPETATVANISSINASSGHEQYLPQENKTPEPVQKPVENPATGKHIFVSMPGAVQSKPKSGQEQITKKEEKKYQPSSEISTPPTTSKPSYTPVEEQQTETRFARTLNDAEEDYTSWIVNQSKKKKLFQKRRQYAITGGALVICAVIFFIVRGQFADKKTSAENNLVSMSNEKPAVESSVPAKEDKNLSAEKTTQTEPQQNEQEESINNITSSSEEMVKHSGTTKNSDRYVSKDSRAHAWETQQTGKKIINDKNRPVIQPVVNKEQKNKVNPDPHTTAKATQHSANTTQEQMRDIQSAPSAEIRQGSGRTATRRDTYSEANTNSQTSSNTAKAEPVNERPAVITVSPDDVQITDNHSDDWMMGISGLKVTVRNTAPVSLKTAAVEVLYFDENNRLLDKKSLVFNNIQPRGRVTLPAPDQKWADHVEYRLRQLTAGN